MTDDRLRNVRQGSFHGGPRKLQAAERIALCPSPPLGHLRLLCDLCCASTGTGAKAGEGCATPRNYLVKQRISHQPQLIVSQSQASFIHGRAANVFAACCTAVKATGKQSQLSDGIVSATKEPTPHQKLQGSAATSRWKRSRRAQTTPRNTSSRQNNAANRGRLLSIHDATFKKKLFKGTDGFR